MQPTAVLGLEDDLVTAMEKLVTSGFHELPVVDGGGAIIGFVEDADAIRAYLALISGKEKTE